MPEPSRRTSRALVVEDDRSWQQILVELLSDAGLTVDVADSYATALTTMRAAAHRIAVVDLSLGGSDHHNQEGLQVLDAIRRHDPGCESILLTGFATVEIAVTSMKEYGAHTCLRKELFRRAQFGELVQVLLAETGGRSAVTESRDPVFTTVTGGQIQGGAQILVVEDDAGWRDIFMELLADAGHDARVCRSYGEALAHLSQGIDLAIVDLSLASSVAPDDNVDGFRLLEVSRRAGIPAVVVSGIASPEDAEAAYQQYGAFAFFEKQDFSRRAFRQAVEAALTARPAQPSLDLLTGREREVLELLVQGMTNKQIAEALVISPNTVKRHLKAIFAKLEVNTRTAAVAKAMEEGV